MSHGLDIPTLVEQFHRDGYLHLPGALSPEHAERAREGVLAAFAGPENGYGPVVRVRMFEYGPLFEELVDHAPVVDVMEAILGPDCHLIAQNALLTTPGQSIAGSFHSDDLVRVPIPRDVRLDPRIRMPCFVVNMNYFLCDVDEGLGPTQVVPTSHRSGRQPEPEDMDADGMPVFEGHGVTTVTARAGDALLWHDQVWHRGAPNRSHDGVRIVQQGSYGKRMVSQRFYPFVNYQLPPGVMERATPRRLRLLGLHGRGAYG